MPQEKLSRPAIGRFIDPLTDFGVKRIFGSKPNKDLLIAILNDLFSGRKTVVDLTYNQNEANIRIDAYRKSIFDLTCTGKDGEKFIIQMRWAEQKFFRDRPVYYTSAVLHAQGPKGRKDWDYELPEVYFIGLMDFSFDNTPRDKYLHRVRLSEKELKTDLGKWTYVLLNMDKLEKIPVISNKRIFQKLFEISEVPNLKKEEYSVMKTAK